MALPTYDQSIITAVAKVGQNVNFPQYIIGGRGVNYNNNFQLHKRDAVLFPYDFTLWRSPVYQIGKNFDVLTITLPVIPDVTTDMAIIPVLYFDNEDTNSIGTTINPTNYPNSERLIKLTSKNFANSVHGRNNFFLELQFTGGALAVVGLPINIELEVEET